MDDRPDPTHPTRTWPSWTQVFTSAARDRWFVGAAALAIALSWSWWWFLVAMGDPVTEGTWRPSHVPGVVLPAVAAGIVAALHGGREAREWATSAWRVRMAWRWWGVALSPLAAVAVLGLVHLVDGTAGGWWSELGRFNGVPEVDPLVLVLVLVFVTGMGEELCWRGWSAPRLLHLGPATAGVVIAVPWILWHVPLFFLLDSYADFEWWMLPGFVIGLGAGSIVFTWLFARSGGSTLAVAAMHGAYDLAVATPATRVLAMPMTVAFVVAALAIGRSERRAQLRLRTAASG